MKQSEGLSSGLCNRKLPETPNIQYIYLTAISMGSISIGNTCNKDFNATVAKYTYMSSLLILP